MVHRQWSGLMTAKLLMLSRGTMKDGRLAAKAEGMSQVFQPWLKDSCSGKASMFVRMAASPDMWLRTGRS